MAADPVDIRTRALELAIDAITKGAAHGTVEGVARSFEEFLSGRPAPTPYEPDTRGWSSPEMAEAAKRMGME